MAQLTVRKLDDELVRRLKVRAAQNNRSAEAEVRAILQREFPQPPSADFWEQAAALRESLKGRCTGDSTALIREQREERTKRLESLMRPKRKRT